MKKILQKLVNGDISVEKAEKMLKTMQIAELEDFAKLDTGRDLRTGFPEAIFAEGKDEEELIKIIQECAKRGRVLITRLDETKYNNIKLKISNLQNEGYTLDYNRKARILLIKEGEI